MFRRSWPLRSALALERTLISDDQVFVQVPGLHLVQVSGHSVMLEWTGFAGIRTRASHGDDVISLDLERTYAVQSSQSGSGSLHC